MSSKPLPLQDAFWFQEGPGVRKWQFRSSGIKLLNVGNILAIGGLDLSKTDRYLSEDEVESRYKHFLVDEGDLVIASSGISFDEDSLLRTRGAFIRRNDLPLCLNTSTIRFKPKHGADLRYLRFWLDSYEFRSQISRLVTGSAQQNFGPSHLENIYITLPSVAEQQRIAGLLEQADRLRRTRRCALELSDTFLPATFLELFGDLRVNPHRFEVLELGDVCDVRDGTHDSPKFHRQGVPLVTSKNLANGFVDLAEVDLISEEDFAKINKRSKVDRGDILMPMIGTIGNPVLVENEPRYAIKNVALIKFVVGSPSAIYTREVLRGSYFEYLTSRNSRGGTQKFIALGDIRDFRVPIPPVPLQQKFTMLVERHERLRAGQVEALRQAEHLFQSLLHRTFGESR